MVDSIDVARSLDLVRHWGFVSHVAAAGGTDRSWLLVALRPAPTLQHFDPERVEYWVTEAGCGRRVTIPGPARLPAAASCSWGTIRAVDRLGIANEWVTFGGTVDAARIDGLILCAFRSDVPILRRGGHSQGWDHGAASAVAFFGRLKIAVDYVPGFEVQLAAASPEVRFAAFVADLAARYRTAPALADVHPELARLLRHEVERFGSADPQTWGAGLELLRAAGLVDVAPRMSAAS
jgi:hypothetical protein